MHADHDPVAGTLAEIHEGEPHGPVLVREGKAAGIRAHDDLLVGEADAPVSGASSPSSIRNGRAPPARSEEHTSELQSLMRISYAVFCLKKKKTKRITQQTQTTNHS